MKFLLTVWALCLLWLPLGAEEGSAPLNQALQQKRWDQAVVLLQQKHKGSGDYYNLGLCYQQLNDPGRARAYYEASLQRNPWNSDLHNNLALLKARLAEPEPDESWLEAAAHCAPPAVLAVTTVAASWLGCALAWLFATQRRERWLWSGLGCITLTALAGGLWALSLTQPQRAAVLPETAVLLNGPGNEFSQSILLHAGHCVEIRRREGDWVEVDAMNKVRAWIRDDQLLWIP